jgi:membrane protein YdbS with pleckstrin-like domain
MSSHAAYIGEPEPKRGEGMAAIDDRDLRLPVSPGAVFAPDELTGWTVRRPSARAQRWSLLNGLAHGLVWAFPFVMLALVWRRVSGADGNELWPALNFSIGIVLLLLFLIKGIFSPRTWWFAYTDRELIAEHGIVFKARDHLAFDRVQYLERRSGPIMRSLRLSSLIFDTAAGRATVPAAEVGDIDAIEEHVRVAMQRAAVL